ncbi:MAG: hypothetical protein J6U98_04365 [Abditibacteriota bacterium]|nr:hypothetical protein [Abditibacteriota bacterium]
MKKLFVILTLLASTAAYCGTKYPISFWVPERPLSEEAVKRAADCGFNLYFDTYATEPEDQKRLLDLCEKYHMKVKIYDKRISRSDWVDPDFSEKIAAAVNDYKDHPALWGYHVVDEPVPGYYYTLARKMLEIGKHDPDKTAFVNMFPYGIVGTNRPLFDRATHERFIEEFMCLTRPKALSYDIYVLAKDPKNDNINGFFNNIEIIRDKALKYDVPFHACILSVEHGGYRDPSAEDLRWQVFNTLVYGGKGLIYFTYAVPGGSDSASFNYQDALLDKNFKPTRRYYDSQKINADLTSIGDTMMDLTSVGVFHTGKRVASYAKDIPVENLIKVTGGEFVLGQFVSSGGEKYAMVTNRLMRETQTAYLTFAQNAKVTEIKPRGKRGLQTAPDKWQKTLAPGDGVLIKIETGDLKYARWDYSFERMPKVSVYAPDSESLAAAEYAKDALFGKVAVNVIGGDAAKPALISRRFGSEAYIIFGDKNCYLPVGMNESKRLADLLVADSAEDFSAFKDVNHIFCPAVIVKSVTGEKLAAGIEKFFEK